MWQMKKSNEEKMAILDRYIISNTDQLENNETLLVRVNDGFLVITKEYDEEIQREKTKTYFNEFDSSLDIDFKELLETKIKIIEE